MNILLLNPPFIDEFSRTVRRPSVTDGSTIYYPIWLAYAAGAAENAGHNVSLIDGPSEGLYFQGLHRGEDILDPLNLFIPDLVVCDTSAVSLYNDLQVAGHIKEKYPETFILLVGVHPSALPEETLKLSLNIDAVAMGEYDYTILDIANALDKKQPLNDIDGLVFRSGSRIIRNNERSKITNLDDFPFVSSIYEKHLNYKNYFSSSANYPMMMIITSRGCPFQCSYCVHPQVLQGKEYRSRSAENVVDEFEYIVNHFPDIKEIGIEDDCFSIDKKRVEKICDLLIKRAIDINWYCNVRGDLDYNLLKKMKEAGCRLVSVGFESGCQNILDNIHKNITIKDYYEFAKNAKMAGILIKGCFIIGSPGDERETMAKSYKFARKLGCDTVRFYPLYLYPGTEAFTWAKENKFIEKDEFSDWLMEDGLQNCILNLKDLSAKDMVYLSDHYEKKYCFRPKYLLKKLYNAANNHQEGRLDLKTGKRFLMKFLKDQIHRSR